MVRPVSGRVHPRGVHQARESSKLNQDQKAVAREILSDFDPQHLTDRDKDEIRDALTQAGIGPSEDLKQIFEEEGFESSKAAKKPDRPPAGPPMRPPARAAMLSESARGTLMGFLEKHQHGQVTRGDLEQLHQTLKNEGAPSVGWLIDIRV